MKIEVFDTWHNTSEIFENMTLEEVKSEILSECKWRAENVAQHEVEDDWECYYPNYETALKVTYKEILRQFLSEKEYKIIN
ncbi:hypothetical protein WRP3_040 [Lactococcus phage WRP3]|uniref:Uncharacterized protein n=1 Tax=Lactococcus phage WRP3 TaxID=1560313 RepID=A0A0D3MTB3_9CAUD|nr:hypothetical protein ACQ37_gp040 [Lactococcus phage WRP3]AIX12543.1 hypothetical protein WRP3_040 [Lactococcus phage WRP3]